MQSWEDTCMNSAASPDPEVLHVVPCQISKTVGEYRILPRKVMGCRRLMQLVFTSKETLPNAVKALPGWKPSPNTGESPLSRDFSVLMTYDICTGNLPTRDGDPNPQDHSDQTTPRAFLPRPLSVQDDSAQSGDFESQAPFKINNNSNNISNDSHTLSVWSLGLCVNHLVNSYCPSLPILAK
jgi:hypothetical protein